jgi:S-adenosylmethionine-diacylglycerol 3-amino-3-carboxypropyl transferase
MTASTRPAAPVADASSILAGGELRYSTVWEDHLLLERGLEPRAGADVLVLASAGDNVLNLLLREPRRIVAIDINPAQSALVELQLVAISTLDYVEFLQLLGFVASDAGARVTLYERVRARLGDTSRAWWDDHVATIAFGISGSGRLDRYIAGFRDAHLSDVQRSDTIERLLSAKSLVEQRSIATELFTPTFARAFTEYFSADKLGARGRDPSQMRYVGADMDVESHLLSRLEWACTELSLAGNFYVERFFRGGLRDTEAGPPYLRRENFARLRGLLSRVEIVTGEVGDYLASRAPGSLSHAALSDVFEYLSEEATAALVDRLARAIRPGGRIAYWNLFVPRAGSTTSSRFRWLADLSRHLWARDRAWFYRAFRIEEVVA